MPFLSGILLEVICFGYAAMAGVGSPRQYLIDSNKSQVSESVSFIGGLQGAREPGECCKCH